MGTMTSLCKSQAFASFLNVALNKLSALVWLEVDIPDQISSALQLPTGGTL